MIFSYFCKLKATETHQQKPIFYAKIQKFYKKSKNDSKKIKHLFILLILTLEIILIVSRNKIPIFI